MPLGNYAPVEETTAKRCCLIIDFCESISSGVFSVLKLLYLTSNRINSSKMQLKIYFIRRCIKVEGD